MYENGWNSSLEDNLCMLWDMSSEKDVVEFLLENDFFRIAEFTIKISEEPRLTVRDSFSVFLSNESCYLI